LDHVETILRSRSLYKVKQRRLATDRRGEGCQAGILRKTTRPQAAPTSIEKLGFGMKTKKRGNETTESLAGGRNVWILKIVAEVDWQR
jgi:hypothetical protein